MRTVIAVKVKTRAPKPGIDGFMPDGTLKVRVCEAPVKGKANKAVLRLLAEYLSLPESALELISGASSSRKLVRVSGLSQPELQKRFIRGGFRGGS